MSKSQSNINPISSSQIGFTSKKINFEKREVEDNKNLSWANLLDPKFDTSKMKLVPQTTGNKQI